MGRILKILVIVFAVLSLIGMFIITDGMYETGVLWLVWFIVIGFESLILYCVGEIEENTSTLKEEVRNLRSSIRSEKEFERTNWKCPKCGRVNSKIVSTCQCGTSKPRD